jgi:hypothetical protein
MTALRIMPPSRTKDRTTMMERMSMLVPSFARQPFGFIFERRLAYLKIRGSLKK